MAYTKYTDIKNITNGMRDSWAMLTYADIKNTKYNINFNTVESIKTPEKLANLEYLGRVITNADKMLIAAKKAGVANTAHDDLAGIIKRKIIAAKTVHIAATIMYLVNWFCIFTS